MAAAIDEIVTNEGFNLIVVIDSGSTVKCVKGEEEIYSQEISGAWYFKLDIGDWEIICELNGNIATKIVEIGEDTSIEIIKLGYGIFASDFDLASYGVIGTDYEVVYDDDKLIPEALWSTTKNWKIRFLTSGTLKMLKDGEIDIFCGGGGAGGGYTGSSKRGGGGAGYTNTYLNYQFQLDDEYEIVVGSGGSGGTGTTSGNGGTSKFSHICIAAGGYGVTQVKYGGNGGSGGGGKTDASNYHAGGTDGNNGDGNAGGKGQRSTPGPNGETGSTREFGESTGRLYATGGHSNSSTAGGNNTCDGGSGVPSGNGENGGSGIVVIRNARQ